MSNVKFLISHTINKLQDNLKVEFVYKDEVTAKKIVSELRKRFGKFLEEVKTFIIEYPYIEKEWRELYSLHYCKTNYDKTTPFVYRIHFFDRNIKNLEDVQDDDSSYLGYVTIRPLPVSFISKIVLRQYRKFYNLPESQDLYMITAEYEVHIGNKSIKFEAFPLFSQDSVISACAHADAIIVAEIMYKRHKMSKISIEKFISKIPYSDKGREIPSNGLNIEHLASALMENGCFVRTYTSKDEGNDHLLEILEAHIESGLPCILGFGDHVIVIAGHTISMDENGESKFGYVVFDDSGYHTKKTFYYIQNVTEPKYASPLFSIIVPKEKLLQKLMGWNVVLICPIFERFYFPLESAENLVKEVVKSAVSAKNQNFVARKILTDSRNLHKFLEYELETEDYKNVSFPHYVWYVEFYSEIRGKKESLEYIMIIDASAHKDDEIYSTIKTYNNRQTCKPKNKKIYGLLTKF
ncbi:conserved hypothetical protein [groundwater metagenome]|uniref:Uncharacterized protein n=1 Tax=groundwater metagenome TaxID=717931 RepID=A0A098E8G0_9ZZZZ